MYLSTKGKENLAGVHSMLTQADLAHLLSNVCTTFCKGSKVLVHKDCYWIYHEVVHGLRLDAVSWVQTLQAQSVSTPPSTDSSYTEGIEI